MLIAILIGIGGTTMKTTTKTIFLTLVMVFFGSMGFAQDKKKAPPAKVEAEKVEPKKLNADDRIDQLKIQKQSLDRQLTTCQKTHSGKSDTKKCEDLTEQLNKVDTELSTLETSGSSRKTTCESIEKGISDITKDFNFQAQQEALQCMSGDAGDTPQEKVDILGAVVRAQSGVREKAQEICDISSSKTPQSEKLEKKLTAIEKLERDLEKLEEQMVDEERKANEKLADMNEDRIKLSEAWEKKQTDQEKEQAKEVASVRENQIKLQQAIREANSKLIVARQEHAKVKRKRTDELLKAGVQNFKSMERICKAQATELAKKSGYTTKKVGKNLADGTNRGGGQVSDLNSFYQDCLKSMNDKRQAIYEDYGNHEVQSANDINNRVKDIETLEGEYKQLTKSYNEALQRTANSMSKELQAYQKNDANLAMKINQFQISTEKQRQNLSNRQKLLLQKIEAAELSNGKISEREVEAGVATMVKYKQLIKELGTNSCPAFERYKNDAATIEALNPEEVKANK